MSKKSKYTSIGGSALMEGVMMRGNGKMAMAVRKSNSSIILRVESVKPANKIIGKIPILRGIVGFIQSMITSYKALMYSADISMEEVEEMEPESKFEKWLTNALGKGLMTVLTVIAGVLGVVLSVVLFFYLPTLLCDLFSNYVFDLGPVWKRVVVGVIKMLIFMGYMLLVSRMNEMRRLFQYHGGEHKTIFCFEANKPLTPENAKTFKRFHPRCGTSFIVITLIVSIFVSMIIPWKTAALHTVLKLLFLPLVMGIAYECIKLAGKYDNAFTRIISAPGVWFQHITTKEPDEKQLEVAIWAMRGVLEEYPMDKRLIVADDGSVIEDVVKEDDKQQA